MTTTRETVRSTQSLRTIAHGFSKEEIDSFDSRFSWKTSNDRCSHAGCSEFSLMKNMLGFFMCESHIDTAAFLQWLPQSEIRRSERALARIERCAIHTGWPLINNMRERYLTTYTMESTTDRRDMLEWVATECYATVQHALNARQTNYTSVEEATTTLANLLTQFVCPSEETRCYNAECEKWDACIASS